MGGSSGGGVAPAACGRVVATVSAVLLAGCSSLPERHGLVRYETVQEQLQKELGARVLPYPDSADAVAAWERPQLVVCMASRRKQPIGDLDPETRRALKQYVVDGGRLLLLGFASRLVHEMGIEPQAPDRFAFYRWGDSEQTLVGEYRFGLRVKDPKHNDLVWALNPAVLEWRRAEAEPGTEPGTEPGAEPGTEPGAEPGTEPGTETGTETQTKTRTRTETGAEPARLEPAKVHANAFCVGGGELVVVQSCHWENEQPQNGNVIGRMFRIKDGEPAELGAAVLTAWGHGQGRVLAYGNMPEPWRQSRIIQHNAQQLLRNAIRNLCGGRPDRGKVLVLSDPQKIPPRVTRLPPLAERHVPGAAVIPHWGWQVALNYQHLAKDPWPPKRLLNEVLVPSHQAGASLLDLGLWDAERGYPLLWSAKDPLQRPDTYHGGGFWRDWSAPALHGIATQAHQRGMLLQLWLNPGPARGGSAAEMLACGKFLARELCDVRRFGAGAFDGLGLHTGGVYGWFDDQDGHTRAVLQSYQPAAHGYCTGRAPVSLPGFAGAVNANHGRPRGLNAAGISTQWRNAFPAPDHLAAVLDCRTRRPAPSLWNEHALGGGSYGDWILTQANDFARERIGQGAAMWWQAYGDATMTRSVVDYVHGVSMQPLKAAVAARFWATGQGGYRQLVRGFVGATQSGFGAETPLPAATAFLQNNHFRLCGSGGALLLDPGGLARFRDRDQATGTRRVAAPFLVSRWRGIRPDLQVTNQHVVDFIHGRPRGEGGYGPELLLRKDAQGPNTFPAALALDQPDRWPRKITVDALVVPGHYELVLALRATHGRGIVELRRDGELDHLFRFRDGDGSKRYKVPIPVAEGGRRTFSLEVVDGGAVAIEACLLTRRGRMSAMASVPTETWITERAGHLAELQELTTANEFRERRTFRTIADLPGFVMKIDYGSVRGAPEVRRQFGLENYRRIRLQDHQDPQNLRAGFVLEAPGTGLPNLAVVPLRLPRYHRFEFDKNRGLTMVGFPRSNEQVHVGFLFLRDTPAATIGQLGQLLRGVSDPPRLEVGENGTAEILPAVPLPHPRVVRVLNQQKTPYLVREKGSWLFRGGQRARDGGEWLLVYHLDQAAVALATGKAATGRVRPGPGSLHSITVSDVVARRFTVRVLQTGPFLSAPAVVVPWAFGAVQLDGKPWSYLCGQTIYLPRARGIYTVALGPPEPESVGHTQTQTQTQMQKQKPEPEPVPTLARTAAHVRTCRFDHRTRVLEVFTVPDHDPRREYCAWVTGAPVRIEGGSRVPESELTYAQTADAEAAAAAGVLVRFRAGLLRVHYAGAGTLGSKGREGRRRGKPDEDSKR